jgi:hypothetical protein
MPQGLAREVVEEVGLAFGDGVEGGPGAGGPAVEELELEEAGVDARRCGGVAGRKGTGRDGEGLG